VRIVRLKPYRRAMERMGFDDAGMQSVEMSIAAAPESNPMIKGLRGVRKARFALAGRGKSGGRRAIYYLAAAGVIYMMTAYPKNERDDLSADQRRAILAVIEEVKGGAG
jgi:hypothetical protein